MTSNFWAPGMRGAVATVALLLARESVEEPPAWVGDWLVRDDREATVDRIRRHKLTLAVLPVLGELPLTQAQRESLVSAARFHRMRALVLAADQVAALGAMETAGIPAISLKGMAFAAQTTGDFAARVTGDIDVLVAPEDAAQATWALQDAGVRLDTDYCPVPGSPLFPAATRALKASLLHTAHTDLDLHWRLDVERSCCSASFHELWDRSVEVDVGGQPVRTLGPVDAAIFCASHGTTDAWSSLRQVVDQVRVDRLAPEAQVAPAAIAMGARIRYEVSRAMVAPLVGGSPHAGRRARAIAAASWSWLAAGRDIRAGTGLDDVRHRLVLQLGAAYDSPSALFARLAAAGWPVEDMAERKLGRTGDVVPGTYLVWGIAKSPSRLRRKVRRLS